MIKDLGITCPSCGCRELTDDGNQLHIRAYKVTTQDGLCWSQCLVCAGYYDKPNGQYVIENGVGRKGWFAERV